MEIKAADVKALRDKTGAGMMECKKALTECNGDEEAAIKLLKEKGVDAEIPVYTELEVKLLKPFSAVSSY